MKDYVTILESNEASSCAVMLVIYHAECCHINIDGCLQLLCFKFSFVYMFCCIDNC